jgi:1,4-dihydroxy-2-naphthoyl-CoA hydrolase
VNPTTGQLGDRMGIVILEASASRVVATMPAEGNLQPFGVVNGGAYCVLGETLGSVAANAHAGPGYMAVGIEINASHHRSAAHGLLTATATAISLGRTLCTHEVVILDEDCRRVSTVRITNIIRKIPGAATNNVVVDGNRSTPETA